MSTQEKNSHLYNIRHSLAHMLAQAVLDMFPEAKLGTGPVTENGFYYDFDLPRTLIPEDLKLLEKKMRKFVQQNQSFVRREEELKPAIEFLKTIGQPYKIELIEKFAEQKGVSSVSFYENVREADKKSVFVDLCEGGHVENTKEIDAKCFTLSATSSAYWQADENNTQMQRIYGIAFESGAELATYEKQMEEAKKRDHRKLGKELELYVISPLVGGGLPLWAPKGAMLRDVLIEFMKKEQLKRGYQMAITPHIAKVELFQISGHWQNYRESMFTPMKIEDEEYVMKAMNCPLHCQIYNSRKRSYRELPFRLAEFGTVYRYEQSGELNGLTRVRGFTQDDAHIYCRPEQVKQEFLNVLDLVLFVFEKIGFKDYRVRIGLRDPKSDKYIGSDEMWEKAQNDIEEAVQERKMSYTKEEGDAAFYGPKLDFVVRDVIDREWQLGTIQVDYNLPERFELNYIGEDGKEHRPVMIHRAPFGSLERFIGILIEHFAGAFPFWLAPVQAKILAVSEHFNEYAQSVAEQLREQNVRVEVDDSNETLGKKIRNAEMEKVPYMIVVGEKEVSEKKINVRNYATKEQTTLSVEEFLRATAGG